MKRMAWRWTLAVSALALAITACTVTSDDEEDEDGGAGSGGATGGSGGATGGTGGGGTGGGGTGGGTGGTAGTAGTGGSGGEFTCEQLGDDTCSTCVKASCCDEAEACYNDPLDQCIPQLECLAECTDDYETCKSTCDAGNFNVPYNEYILCTETNCFDECGS